VKIGLKKIIDNLKETPFPNQKIILTLNVQLSAELARKFSQISVVYLGQEHYRKRCR
jgi:hypothetical protein